MRLLFTTDLHGSKWKYGQLFEVAEEFRADVVINGGDMLPGNCEPVKQGEFIIDYTQHRHKLRFLGSLVS
jgi:Icc-related predicted phosphoesterase